MAYRIVHRYTRDDGTPGADLRDEAGGFVRVHGALAHALEEGQYVTLTFTPADAPPVPAPAGHVLPLVQVRLGGTVSAPKE